jgi:CRP-like cAMP-binding protein
MAELWLFQ